MSSGVRHKRVAGTTRKGPPTKSAHRRPARRRVTGSAPAGGLPGRGRSRSASGSPAAGVSPCASGSHPGSSPKSTGAPGARKTHRSMAARRFGTETISVVPWPRTLSRRASPPSLRADARTASSPTPRPEISETWSRVEKPGAKSSSASCASSVASRGARPSASAFRRTASKSTPAPSSATPTSSRSPRSRTAMRSAPVAGFPAPARSPAGPTPWSTALRTPWSTAVLIASRTSGFTRRSGTSTVTATAFPSSAASSFAATAWPAITGPSGTSSSSTTSWRSDSHTARSRSRAGEGARRCSRYTVVAAIARRSHAATGALEPASRRRWRVTVAGAGG